MFALVTECGLWCQFLKRVRGLTCGVQVETFVKASDKNDDQHIDFGEFEHLVHQMAEVDKRIHGLHIE